jgi:colanic acid biosynthesis glycosyl transferase WcaI
MRVVFLNRYFHPDYSATSVLLSDLAFALSQRGIEVSVITSRLHYEAGDRLLPQHETIQGLKVHRVWTSRRGRAGLLGRSLDYGTFYSAAAWRLWRLTRANDVIVAKTDPPLLSVMAALIARIKGAYLVNWLQDIFPEAAEALNIGGGFGSAALRLMRPLRNWSLRSAQTNVVVGTKMAEYLEAEGIPLEKIRIISNWADGTLIVPIVAAQNELRQKWELNERFVVGYAGNLGRAHDIATIINAISLLQERAIGSAIDDVARRITFVFVGGGAQLARLDREAIQRRLSNVQLHQYQPRECLAETLGVADLHLVSLNPELEGLIVPSKFYGIAAAGRPTIFIGAADGEIARLIDETGCGFTVAPADGQTLLARILQAAGDPKLCVRVGARARAAFEERWDKRSAVEQWEEVLKAAVNPTREQVQDAPRREPRRQNESSLNGYRDPCAEPPRRRL